MTKPIAKQVANEIGDVYEDLIHSLGKMVRHLRDEAGDQLSAKGLALAHAAEDLIEEAGVQSRTLAEKAGREVREHPATTAAIAAAAVALLGVAISRRIQPGG